MGQFSEVLYLLIMHTQYHRGPWTVDQAYVHNHSTPLCIQYLKKHGTLQLHLWQIQPKMQKRFLLFYLTEILCLLCYSYKTKRGLTCRHWLKNGRDETRKGKYSCRKRSVEHFKI